MQEVVTQNLAEDPEKMAELPLAVIDVPVDLEELDRRLHHKVAEFKQPFKASHEESKKQRKAAAKSRKINRHK